MDRIWLQAGAEAVARAEAEGVNLSDSEFLVVAQGQWQCPYPALVLLVIPQIVQAAQVQKSELSPAQHSLTLVILQVQSLTLLELDFGFPQQDHQDKEPGKRCQGQSYQLSHREQPPCGGSQWRPSG